MRPLPVLMALLLLFGWTVPAWSGELLFSPGPGEKTADDRPVITVQLPSDRSLVPETARLWVNGREVTGQCLRTPFFISFQPPGAWEPGPVAVRFNCRSADGEPVERQWTFEVQPAERIRSVTHDATAELGEFEDLAVEMQAEPGGKAWFEIEGVETRTPMEETSPGQYRGTYRVQPGDYRLQAKVIAHLEFGPRTFSREADTPVTLFGQLFRVVILSPKTGSKVPLSFDIKGRTRPRAHVNVVPKIGFDEGMSAPNRSDGGQVGAIPAQADDDGNFTVHYGMPIKLPNMRVVMTITATDEEGNRAIPATLYLEF